jgi:hypothetical protein
MEQDLKLRMIEDYLVKASKEDIVTVFLALQKQCFVLGNNMSNLVKQWPTHPNTMETTGKLETS